MPSAVVYLVALSNTILNPRLSEAIDMDLTTLSYERLSLSECWSCVCSELYVLENFDEYDLFLDALRRMVRASSQIDLLI